MLHGYELRRRVEIEVRSNLRGTRLAKDEQAVQAIIDSVTNVRLAEYERILRESIQRKGD